LLSLALHGLDRPTSVKEIAERTALPQPYLEQILLAAKGAGLVRSKRGVGGGYVLARPPGEITLAEILAAVDGPKISGKTSRALRARANVAFVQAGLSRSVFSALRFRFISLYLTFVRLAQADDMSLACARSKYQHVQAASNQSQCLKSLFAVGATQILHDQRAIPLELSCQFERDSPHSEVAFALRCVKTDVHSFSVYTYIH